MAFAIVRPLCVDAEGFHADGDILLKREPIELSGKRIGGDGVLAKFREWPGRHLVIHQDRYGHSSALAVLTLAMIDFPVHASTATTARTVFVTGYPGSR